MLSVQCACDIARAKILKFSWNKNIMFREPYARLIPLNHIHSIYIVVQKMLSVRAFVSMDVCVCDQVGSNWMTLP